MTGKEALRLIQKCFREERRFLHRHCLERMKLRHLEVADVGNAVRWARAIEEYPTGFDDVGLDEGEAWRVVGPSLQDDPRGSGKRMIAVGVQLVVNETGESTIVVTVF